MTFPPSRLPFITCIRLVQGLIRADDIITPEETEFIERLMEDMSFNQAERDASAEPIGLDNEEAVATLRELSSPMRKGLLETLIKASRSDGHVDPREMEFVQTLARVFRVDAEELDALWLSVGGRQQQKSDEEIQEKFAQLDISRLNPDDEPSS